MYYSPECKLGNFIVKIMYTVRVATLTQKCITQYFKHENFVIYGIALTFPPRLFDIASTNAHVP